MLGYSNIFGNVEFFFLRRFSFLEILIFVMYTNIVKVSCIPQFGKFLFLECMQKSNIVSWSLLEFIYKISNILFHILFISGNFQTFIFGNCISGIRKYFSFMETAIPEIWRYFSFWKIFLEMSIWTFSFFEIIPFLQLLTVPALFCSHRF